MLSPWTKAAGFEFGSPSPPETTCALAESNGWLEPAEKVPRRSIRSRRSERRMFATHPAPTPRASTAGLG